MNTAVLQGVLFKAVQISVAAFFTLLVWVQTFVAGFGRLFGDPAALVKVQQARQAAVGLTALSGPEVAADEAAPAALQQQQQQQLESSLRQRAQQKQQQHGAEDACGSSGPVQPVHVFPQPELGEQLRHMSSSRSSSMYC
jgi:transcription initiation factor TFIID subunit TAF12